MTPLLTLLRPVPSLAGHNTDLPLHSNISKKVRVNIAFARNIFYKIFNKLSNGMQVNRLCTCGSKVIDAIEVIIDISKIKFFNFSGTERVK